MRTYIQTIYRTHIHAHTHTHTHAHACAYSIQHTAYSIQHTAYSIHIRTRTYAYAICIDTHRQTVNRGLWQSCISLKLWPTDKTIAGRQGTVAFRSECRFAALSRSAGEARSVSWKSIRSICNPPSVYLPHLSVRPSVCPSVIQPRVCAETKVREAPTDNWAECAVL